MRAITTFFTASISRDFLSLIRSKPDAFSNSSTRWSASSPGFSSRIVTRPRATCSGGRPACSNAARTASIHLPQTMFFIYRSTCTPVNTKVRNEVLVYTRDYSEIVPENNWTRQTYQSDWSDSILRPERLPRGECVLADIIQRRSRLL